MRFKAGFALAATVMGMLVAGPVSAATLKFTLNGPARAVWFLDSSPKPFAFGSGSFVLQDVEGNYSGIPGNEDGVNYFADMEFYTDNELGGFYLYNFYEDRDLLTTNSEQLFTGTTAAPTFKTGNFTLTDYNDPSVQYSLSIAGVPEPASWAFMIAGFGAVGGSLRARRVKVKLQIA